MMKTLKILSLVLSLTGGQFLFSQTCVADAGENISICDGDGTSSNYTYLDASGSSISDGSDPNFEWTVLTVVGDGSWRETLVITSSESDEEDPRFKYPKELAVDTDFEVQLRVYNDDETCESFDTIVVSIQANMCPRADAGDSQTLSNGCDITVSLDGSDSEDVQDDPLTYTWSSLDGYDSNFIISDSSISEFMFPSIVGDRTFSFQIEVNDGVQSAYDTVTVLYLDNDAPVADAGHDISTCEYQFKLNGTLSYDANWNDISYSWNSPDGLSISSAGSATPIVTSPTNLTEETTYTVSLEVNDGYCSSFDTVLVTIAENICPIADAGETVRVPKFESTSVTLIATNSFDPDGNSLSYEWTTPFGEIITDSVITISDEYPNERYTSYIYSLKVMDEENAIATDSVEVIFSDFSAPISPNIFAVASHGQVLVSWDAISEASYDSLTGYADFEGYKLYRSTDGGATWGTEDDKLYDFNGEFVGYRPFAQFDFSYSEDYNHCIYNHEGDCESEETRQTSISGLDPFAPRFTLGSNTGISYSFVDSNVVDGVEYSYTVTAYDIGLSPFDVTYSEIDSSGIFEADTVWSSLNPGQFIGPDTIAYYDESGNWIRDDANPERGFPYLESRKGELGDHNFITVVPGYTALDISFPDADDIEALFTSDTNNIGSGVRSYFIVDRTQIVQDFVKYEIQAKQSNTAVEGMACEDPFVFGYVANPDDGTPVNTITYYEDNLNFYEKDSIGGLPGTVYENGSYIVPDYDIITEVGKWSNQFKGIRYKIENIIPLDTSAVPDVSIDTLAWSWAHPDSGEIDTLTLISLFSTVGYELSYTNIASYNRRLNFDYQISFFDQPIGDTIEVTNATGTGNMYLPFRITNMHTGKKVGLGCNDFGRYNDSPAAYGDGASDFVWTRGEEIFLISDSLRVAGEWIVTYNYNLDLTFFINPRQESKNEYNPSNSYVQGDLVFYKQMLWVAETPADAGVPPLSIQNDLNDDGERNNPWRLAYAWPNNIDLLISPQKLFVDGDNWDSDMRKLGEKVGIDEDLCLDTIKVVPNPYKASSAFNETQHSRRIRFTHLPTQCQISIYTITGEHVTTFQHEEEFDGNAWWNLRTGNNQDGPEVAPGLYIYVIEFPEEREYCVDTYDNDGDVEGSGYDDYYSNKQYDFNTDGSVARVKKKTKYHIGKFAVIR